MERACASHGIRRQPIFVAVSMCIAPRRCARLREQVDPSVSLFLSDAIMAPAGSAQVVSHGSTSSCRGPLVRVGVVGPLPKRPSDCSRFVSVTRSRKKLMALSKRDTTLGICFAAARPPFDEERVPRWGDISAQK